MTRLKLAELTSGIGALVLGVGLGAVFPGWFGPAAGLITFAGLCVHAFGMWDKHRLEAMSQADNSPWGVVPALSLVTALVGQAITATAPREDSLRNP